MLMSIEVRQGIKLVKLARWQCMHGSHEWWVLKKSLCSWRVLPWRNANEVMSDRSRSLFCNWLHVHTKNKAERFLVGGSFNWSPGRRDSYLSPSCSISEENTLWEQVDFCIQGTHMASRLLVLVLVALGAPHGTSIAVGLVVVVFAVLQVVLVAVGGMGGSGG